MEGQTVSQILPGESSQQSTSVSSPPVSDLRGTNLMTSVASPHSEPPKIRTESISHRRSLYLSSISTSKSRLIEPPCPFDLNLATKKGRTKVSSGLPQLSTATASVTSPAPILRFIAARTPVIITPDEDAEDEGVYKKADLKGKTRKIVIIEWILLVSITGLLLASLTVNGLENKQIWGLKLWKWCIQIMMIFCGRFFSHWFIICLVFLLKGNFQLQQKVLFFFGMRKSVILFIWLDLILLGRILLFIGANDRSEKANKILTYLTRTLTSTFTGVMISLLKTLFVKFMSSLHWTRFFNRIQESMFNHYALSTLSGPPLMENVEMLGKTNKAILSFRNLKKQTEEVINVEKLNYLKQRKVSAWTMEGLINVIRSIGLSILEEGGTTEKRINNEWEATAAAYQIFRNVAKPDSKYIEEEDLLRFLTKKEVDTILPQFEGAADTKRIKRKSLKNWLVNVYLERKALALSLSDTKRVIEELNELLSWFMATLIIAMWLLIMDFFPKIDLLYLSPLLLFTFVFGSSAKKIYKAIYFLFVIQPFDVGDRCIIDGVQMIGEEINLFTTIFLKYNNEKVLYPNSVLAVKPMNIFYWRPEMGDSIEFSVNLSTSLETIGALKERVKWYLESKPQHWWTDHAVIVKEIENMNKMKLSLKVNHTINFQNYNEKNTRRSNLVLELKKIFEDLKIEYHLLP